MYAVQVLDRDKGTSAFITVDCLGCAGMSPVRESRRILGPSVGGGLRAGHDDRLSVRHPDIGPGMTMSRVGDGRSEGCWRTSAATPSKCGTEPQRRCMEPERRLRWRARRRREPTAPGPGPRLGVRTRSLVPRAAPPRDRKTAGPASRRRMGVRPSERGQHLQGWRGDPRRQARVIIEALVYKATQCALSVIPCLSYVLARIDRGLLRAGPPDVSGSAQ
jgi:hypothetical protein